jgi:hypothetical protein
MVQNIFNQDIGRFPLVVSAIGLIILALIWAIAVRKPNKDLEATLNH